MIFKFENKLVAYSSYIESPCSQYSIVFSTCTCTLLCSYTGDYDKTLISLFFFSWFFTTDVPSSVWSQVTVQLLRAKPVGKTRTIEPPHLRTNLTYLLQTCGQGNVSPTNLQLPIAYNDHSMMAWMNQWKNHKYNNITQTLYSMDSMKFGGSLAAIYLFITPSQLAAFKVEMFNFKWLLLSLCVCSTTVLSSSPTIWLDHFTLL